jgi:hypothetical protein
MELREEGVLTGEEFEAAKPGMFPFSPTQLREEIDPHRLPRRNTQPRYHQPNPLDG